MDFMPLASALELARWQFALTTLYHFTFVPLTLGLSFFLAAMQTIGYRTGNDAWLRLTKFLGMLFVINFGIGAATGIIQEFQFGMNWSVFSRFVGDVFGSPLAVEGLAAFFLESTFIGLWLFGWHRLSPRVHLATIWLVALGTWLSAYFILAANSWMQHPVGFTTNPETGRAEIESFWALLSQEFTVFAFVHTMLAALTVGSALVLGVAAWQLLRGREVPIWRGAAKLAVIVAVPVTFLNLLVGSEFGVVVTDAQPMKISAAEALWETEEPASFSLIQIGGFSADDPEPSFEIAIPGLLSFLATNSFTGEVVGMNELQKQAEEEYGPGNYIPDVRLVYWSMRVMAGLGTFSFFVAVWGAWLLWRNTIARSRWFLRTAVAAIAFPFLAGLAGWVLTEAGRQPWVVFGLLKTVDAVTPTNALWTVALSLSIFVALYGVLTAVDIWLMRRYARLDLPELTDEPEEGEPRPAPSY